MKPKLVATEQAASGLGSVTWEQRRKMTAAQLIELMGEKWVGHPDYRGTKPRSLVPMPNLANRSRVFVATERSVVWHIKSLFGWGMR